MSKLQTEFADRGLLVIGANCFNEPKEAVAKFHSEFQVKYQILLDAAAIAQDKYYVTAFPTTFWIDRSGNIVKRSTGFDEEEFDEMKKQLAEMLDQ